MNSQKKEILRRFLEENAEDSLPELDFGDGIGADGMNVDMTKLPLEVAEVMVEYGVESLIHLFQGIQQDMIPDKDWERVNRALKMATLGTMSIGILCDQKLAVDKLADVDFTVGDTIPEDWRELYRTQFGINNDGMAQNGSEAPTDSPEAVDTAESGGKLEGEWDNDGGYRYRG